MMANTRRGGTFKSKESTRPTILGLRKKKLKRERYIVVISDEDDKIGGEQGAGEPCNLDLWGDLIYDRPDQWDIRDALMHGKTKCQDDPSKDKRQRHRHESTDESEIPAINAEGIKPIEYKDAREWEGYDLN